MSQRRRARLTVSQKSGRTDDAITSPPVVKIDIHEVVLRGVQVEDRSELAGAMERELTSMMRDGLPMPALRFRARERIDGGTIVLEEYRGAPVLGRQIAEAVRRSLIEPMPDAARPKSSKH